MAIRRTFTKFIQTHGHARNIPSPIPLERPMPRMKTAVITTSWWAQSENWQPNTDVPGPIMNADDALAYGQALCLHTPTENGRATMRHNVVTKLTGKMTREQLVMLKAAGFHILKIYPEGVTTNSEGGWNSLEELYPQIEWAVELGFIICLHGEEPGDDIDTYERERRFMGESFAKLVKKFPEGRFNVEHISCKETLDMVCDLPKNVTGGITIHHAIITRNDVLEWKVGKRKGLNPNHHCRPPAQTFKDRDALLHAILHADEPRFQKISCGPDSAPWLQGDKLCDCGCAGVCVPNAGPVLVDLYDRNGKLDSPAFYAYTVLNGHRNFNIPIDLSATFELEKEEWEIPKSYGGVVPFLAGRKLGWKPVEPAALDPELLLSM